MLIYRDYKHVPAMDRGVSLAIGNFDGVHLGHKAVITNMLQHAKEHNLCPAVMTFEPHPRQFFSPQKDPLRLFPFNEKARLLAQTGVEICLAQRFNESFSSIPGDAFMQEVLIDALNVKHVVTGEDFLFGYKRSGNAEKLRNFSKESGAFTYQPIAPVGEEATYSSSLIRHCVSHGQMQEAAAILGRPYSWEALVIHGDQRGRTIGFPTANLKPGRRLPPKYGVYAVRVTPETSAQPYDGIANFGERPTVGGEEALLEVHLFDTELDLYGKHLHVEFIGFIREEQKFEGLDALQNQITQDIKQAKRLLAES
ncbi:MAG: bifunctional riboflavin kinase/FAD synthetase [Rickettsiales bacterium]|nr:bifunctional riboflavin kinase/FAD synthetase [Rickettsiales bacterium]